MHTPGTRRNEIACELGALPPTLSIMLWFAGSAVVLAVLAALFDIPSDVVWGAILLGAVVAAFEWYSHKSKGP